MSNYNFEEWGNFTFSDFKEKIDNVKQILVKEFNVDESAIQKIRESLDIGISIGNLPTFSAYVIQYEVLKNEKVIAYLEGHLSNSGDYMHIFLS